MELTYFEEGREWRLPGLLYTDYLVVCGGPIEILTVIIGHFVEVYKRRDLKVNVDKSKGIGLCGENVLVCVVFVDGRQLEHVS